MKAYERSRDLLSMIWFKMYNKGPLRKASATALKWRLDAEMDGQNRRPDLQLYGFQVCQAKFYSAISVAHTKSTEAVMDTSHHVQVIRTKPILQ